MPSYPEAHRKAMGEYVRKMRTERGYADLADWMTETKRSDRYLLGLERGEPVGPKTIKAVAGALGVEDGVLYRILNTGEVPRATAWGEVGDLDDHAADMSGQVDLNLMFSQAVRFAATVGVLVPEVRSEAERVSMAISDLFARAFQLWDRKLPEDRWDDDEDEPLVLTGIAGGGDEGDERSAAASQAPEVGPADQPTKELSEETHSLPAAADESAIEDSGENSI